MNDLKFKISNSVYENKSKPDLLYYKYNIFLKYAIGRFKLPLDSFLEN